MASLSLTIYFLFYHHFYLTINFSTLSVCLTFIFLVIMTITVTVILLHHITITVITINVTISTGDTKKIHMFTFISGPISCDDTDRCMQHCHFSPRFSHGIFFHYILFLFSYLYHGLRDTVPPMYDHTKTELFCFR